MQPLDFISGWKYGVHKQKGDDIILAADYFKIS
jgi:hypothetical protein